jgi:DNA-binding transcriptional regulator YhcF (GntR family)
MPQPKAIISVDASVAAPPFLQIFEQIRALIERGELRPGEPLPTVRQLAGDLGVAPNTVARAYADLRLEGLITTEERRLSRVASASPSASRHSRRKALTEAVDAFLASLASRGYAADEIGLELRKRLGTA